MDKPGKRTCCLVFGLIMLVLTIAYVAAVKFMRISIASDQYYCLQDDAMISMRYASNLASGLGLVWNPGERVQGFTNLGWTLIMAAVHLLKLPLQMNSLILQIINGVLLLALCGVIYWSLKRSNGILAASIATIMVGFNPSMFVYTVNGFEVTLQALLITLSYIYLIPRATDSTTTALPNPSSMLLTATAVVVRPDSIIFFLWSTLTSWICRKATPGSAGCQPASKSTSLRLLVSATLFSALIIIGILTFQYTYYGSILPNTYFLKIAKGEDINWWASWYLLSNFVLNPQGIFLLATIAYLCLCFRNEKLRQRSLLFLLLLLVWFAYVYSVGGDTFLFGRFFIPIIPLLAVCTSLLLSRLLQKQPETGTAKPANWRNRLLAIPISLALLFQLCTFQADVSKPLLHEKWKNESSILSAMAVTAANLPNTYTIGVFRAGATPYFLHQFRFHDMLGKSDPFIARTKGKWGPPGHNKWDIDYSLKEVRPDVLIICFENLTDDQAKQQLKEKDPFGFTPDLWLNSEFRAHYKPNQIPLPVKIETQLLKNHNPYVEWVMIRR